MILQRVLSHAGFQVRVAENGAEGVRQFREWRPQFIWMDIRMPVMDGIEATRLIRQYEGGREVRIVAVTASGDVGKRHEILAEGLDDYVRKPYRSAEVFACMSRHLGCRYQVSETLQKAKVQATGELKAEHLAVLPEELRQELRQAIVTLDRVQISAAIQHISEVNTELGLSLTRFAESYAYSRIFDVIEKAVPPTADDHS